MFKTGTFIQAVRLIFLMSSKFGGVLIFVQLEKSWNA